MSEKELLLIQASMAAVELVEGQQTSKSMDPGVQIKKKNSSRKTQIDAAIEMNGVQGGRTSLILQ